MIAYALQSPAPPFPVLVIAFTIDGFGIALQVDFFFFSHSDFMLCRMLKLTVSLQVWNIKLKRRWASCMLSMVKSLLGSSSVNRIIHCVRSWCFYLTSRCHSVHPALTLVIPLYYLARDCHLWCPRPFRTKTLDGGLMYLFPLTPTSLLSCSRIFYIFSVKKQQRKGKMSIVRLTRSFVSKLSIYPCLCRCGDDHWWFGHSPFLILEAVL